MTLVQESYQLWNTYKLGCKYHIQIHKADTLKYGSMLFQGSGQYDRSTILDFRHIIDGSKGRDIQSLVMFT